MTFGVIDQIVKEATGVARQILGRERDGLNELDEGVFQHSVEQPFLVAEVRVDHPLVDAGPLGDAVDPRPGRAVGGELGRCGGQELLPRLVCIAHHVSEHR